LNRPGSWSSGGEATHEFLKRNGIDDSRYVLVDGSGLARGNRVTARLITDLFVVMHSHRYSELFFSTLPIGGRDGTIAKRMKDIEGHVFAKTGYIGGVRALSGYVRTRRGQWLAFSIIYNNIPGSVAPFEALQDDACRVLVAWPDAPPATQPSTQPVP
jgi:D-alanyl-D-alanine carboxypeptidase/D-alanyl-D-alanine-endopeptidase (penicillin-binding protein 4)